MFITQPDNQQDIDSAYNLFHFLIQYSFLFSHNVKTKKSCTLKTTHFLVSQGNGENGARYLDPKYSRWLSTDPALTSYIEKNYEGPSGGIYNSVNLNLYHYGGNNPVRYTDPDGRISRDEYAYQLIIQGKQKQAKAMEKQAAKDNQGFNYNTLKEFFEIFSGEMKVGLGLNADFIKELGIDLYSMGGSISKDGYKEFSTSSVSTPIASIEKRCEGNESSTLLDPGVITITIGPISCSFDSDFKNPEFDVSLSLGIQIIVGVNISISGKELVDYFKKKFYMLRYFDNE